MIARLASLAVYVGLPVVGVLFLGWDWRPIVLLYWLENITVGLITLVSMGRTRQVVNPGSSFTMTVNGVARPAGSIRRATLMFFFTFHYGLFTVVHGVFVMLLVFGPPSLFGGARVGASPVAVEPINMPGILLVWGVGSLVQFAFSLRTPRDSLPPANSLMMSPYRRIFALHITILGGAWLINWLGWPPAAALLLVGLHVLFDAWTLRSEKSSLRRGGQSV